MFKVQMSFSHSTATGELLPADRLSAAEYHALAVFASLFHSAHLRHGTGSFLHTDGTIVIEPASCVYSYAETVEECYDQLYALGRELIAALDQDSVLLSTLEVDDAHACSAHPANDLRVHAADTGAGTVCSRMTERGAL